MGSLLEGSNGTCLLRVTDLYYDLKLQNTVHLLSYVCKGSQLEGSNGILRVTDGIYDIKLQKRSICSLMFVWGHYLRGLMVHVY